MPKLAIDGGDPVRSAPYPNWPTAGPRERELVNQVLDTFQWGGYHPIVGEFEQLFAQMHDCEHGIALANGSVALEVALEAAGVGRGDEVIVPAHSFVATATAVARLGAEPVFVDIDRGTYNIDPSAIQPALSDKTKAVLAVHFGGIVADMERLAEIAKARELLLFEDAAHAHGAEWNGQRAGSMSLAGAFSFQNTKAMTSGEGGIVVTNNDAIAAEVRSRVNCGRQEGEDSFKHFSLATNLRITGLQAAVLRAQLEQLGEQVALRMRNVHALLRSAEIPGLHFQTVPEQANPQTWYLLPGWIDEDEFGASRDEVLTLLDAEGIPARPFYPHPLYKNPLFSTVPHRRMACNVAEDACEDSFWIPMRLLMGSEEDTLDIARAFEKIHHAVRAQKRQPERVNGVA